MKWESLKTVITITFYITIYTPTNWLYSDYKSCIMDTKAYKATKMGQHILANL